MATCCRQSIVFSSGFVFASVLATQQRQRRGGLGPLVVVAVATSTESVNPTSPLIAPTGLDGKTGRGDGRKQERDVAAGKRTKTVIKNQRLVDVPLAHVRHAGLHAIVRSCSGGFVGMSCS